MVLILRWGGYKVDWDDAEGDIWIIPGIVWETGSGVLESSGEIEVLSEQRGKDVLLPSRVLSEPGGIVKIKHIVLCWFDVEDGSVEFLPVVIYEAVWLGLDSIVKEL